MDVSISNTSEKPIYQQIFDQISAQIIRGDIESNYGLPPIRTASKELRVSIITVKKAWEELERQGYIYTVTGRGCFVSDLSEIDRLNMREKLVQEKMIKDINFYKGFGLNKADIIDAVNKIY